VTTVGTILTVLVAAWMAWRGHSRGAVLTLVGWFPVLAAFSVLLASVRVAWAHPEQLGLFCVVGCVGALVAFAGGRLLFRRVRRRRQTQPRPTGWLSECDRCGGAALGVLSAAVILLASACLASTIPFALGADPRPVYTGGMRGKVTTPEWVDALGEACTVVADISHFGLLTHIPRMGTYSREVRSLIKVLRAPKHKIAHVVAKRGLERLAELDEMQEALLDDDYMAMIQRVSQGDVSALPSLLKSAVTRRVIGCPEVREVAKGLTPSQLARDLDEAPALEEGEDEGEDEPQRDLNRP